MGNIYWEDCSFTRSKPTTSDPGWMSYFYTSPFFRIKSIEIPCIETIRRPNLGDFLVPQEALSEVRRHYAVAEKIGEEIGRATGMFFSKKKTNHPKPMNYQGYIGLPCLEEMNIHEFQPAILIFTMVTSVVYLMLLVSPGDYILWI